jgi:hypothetical protein
MIKTLDGSTATQFLNLSGMVQKNAQVRNAKDTQECKTRLSLEDNAKHGINKPLTLISITEKVQEIFAEIQTQAKQRLSGVTLLTQKRDGNTVTHFLKMLVMVMKTSLETVELIEDNKLTPEVAKNV